MTERIRIDLNGSNPIFKCSKPGVPVLSATMADLLFDMSYGQYSGILITGQAAVSAFASVGSGQSYFGSGAHLEYDVLFGQTLPSPPKCMISMDYPPLPGFRSTALMSSGVSTDVVAKTDRVTLRIWGAGAKPATISYVIYFV